MPPQLSELNTLSSGRWIEIYTLPLKTSYCLGLQPRHKDIPGVPVSMGAAQHAGVDFGHEWSETNDLAFLAEERL